MAADRVRWARDQADHLRATGELSPGAAKLITELVSRQNEPDMPTDGLNRALIDQMLPAAKVSSGKALRQVVSEYLHAQFDSQRRVDDLGQAIAGLRIALNGRNRKPNG